MAKPRPLIALPTLLFAFILIYCEIFASATRHSRLDVKSYNENHNHWPVFTNCSNYAPVIYEEEPPGTEVIQVHAEYRDPSVEGGTITYSFFPDKRLKFAINSTNGMIVTTQIFDRDEPAGEKETYLMVLATNNGRSQLKNFCTFKVTIVDRNDNNPVFKKPTYKESVLRNLPVGNEVMRVSATDIDDGNNSVVRYNLTTNRPEDAIYFRIDHKSGAIFLNQTIDRSPNYNFELMVTATDLGKTPRSSVVNIDIRVEWYKAPAFLPRSAEPIRLPENFSDFDASIVRLEAVSNIDDSSVFFELVTGTTEQTNKSSTFRLDFNKDVADIKLAQHLDYERNTRYSLIVRVKNKYQVTAETVVDVEVLDVNDNIPDFCDIKEGSVLENEPRGVFVMQVRAIDADGTSANNQVSYELDNCKNLFTIDPHNGSVTTLVTFDREVKDSYFVKIIATDNSPSALLKTGEHNKIKQIFRIKIIDKNDNPPRFTQKVYTHNSIYEDANIKTPVTKVKAIDCDITSFVMYSIISGNIDDSFFILAGDIFVNKPLDYEKIIKYNLTVRAFDGMFNDTAQVEIFIENVNDNPPVFEDFNKNLTIQEEKLVDDCITTVVAYDPDIKDRNADQHISYVIEEVQQFSIATIDKSGCIKLKKPLDRDLPNGHLEWNIVVGARDDDGASSTSRKLRPLKINITLLDINDNAPFLDMPYPVIWGENKPHGKITELKARDYDSDENGPPFEFRIDNTADDDIRSKFVIYKTILYAQVTFDREKRKSYDIPIAITDSGTPTMTGTSTLTVIIGDENNPRQHQVV